MSEPLGIVRDLAAALAGEDVPLASDSVDAAIAESVAPLLAASPAATTLDRASRARLRAHARATAIHAAALDDELRRLLPALDTGAAHPPIVIKGAHLAHTVYASPSLRPRTDSDLLIAASERDAVAAALRGAGYTPAPLTSGRLILGQFLYRKALGPGVVHDVDVHWRAAAPLVFAEAFDTAAIAGRGAAIDRLGPAALGPAAADAIALACVHVVAHHWPAGSLRWWNDLRLLADRLDAAGRARFAAAASRGHYREVALAALRSAQAVFPSSALSAAHAAVAAMPAADEASAALTRADRRGIDDFLLDLKVVGWRRGATLIREHLLPPPAYMRLAFGGRPLPIAYAERLVRAVTKRI
jgi:hypothetical protein